MIILLLTALAVTLGGCRHGLQQTLTDMASELGDIVQSDDAEADVPSADVAVPAREEAQEQLEKVFLPTKSNLPTPPTRSRR